MATTKATLLGHRNPASISDHTNTSTGHLDLPSGTTAQRPTLDNAGGTRFNTTTGSLEFYDGTNWVTTNLIPTINSITGNVYATVSSTLTLSITNATDTIDVKYYEGNTLIATDSGVTVTNGSATSTVPSQVYGQTAEDTISIQVFNEDATPSSNSIDKTVLTLPSGGTETTSGNYYIHTFTTSGTFTNTINNLSVEYLVIAGGGGSGNGYAGGGGAGGYRCSVSGETSGDSSSAENALTLAGVSSGTDYTVTVGGGGSGAGNPGTATSGEDSIFSSITSIGGGHGGGRDTGAAESGGSGGGAGGSGTPGTGTSNQGGDGGTGQTLSGYSKGGGGGGASGDGGNAVTGTSGRGGHGADGISSSITGSSVPRAGGGGGGAQNLTGGTGGSGGGGNGGNNTTGGNASTNTGSGGGGGGWRDYTGGNGGSGIVIVRYQLP